MQNQEWDVKIQMGWRYKTTNLQRAAYHRLYELVRADRAKHLGTRECSLTRVVYRGQPWVVWLASFSDEQTERALDWLARSKRQVVPTELADALCRRHEQLDAARPDGVLATDIWWRGGRG